MKRVYALFMAACILLSGCGKGGSDSEETVGQSSKQADEIEAERETETERKETEEETEFVQEETETQPEPMVTICTGIDSEILERDDAFEDMDRWGLYSGVSEDGKSITGEYDLLQIFAPFYGEEKIPLQLWFRDTGDVVVSYCLLENTETTFTVYAFLVEGDSVSVLEKSMLSVRTKEVPESQIYSEENIFASQSGLRDFVVDDFEAYNLSREELQSLRRDRKIQTIGQETGLPGELAEGLQDILIRKQMGEDVSIGDCLESYEAKYCRMDEDLVLEMLEASMSWAELVSAEDAYMADLDGEGKKEIILCGYYGGNGLDFSIEIWRESEEGTGKFIREELGGGRYARLFLIDGAYYYVAGAYSHSLASRVWQVFSFSGGQMVKFGEFAVESRGKEMTWTKFYENENVKPRILESIQAYIEDRKSEIEGEGILQGKAETPMQSGLLFERRAYPG